MLCCVYIFVKILKLINSFDRVMTILCVKAITIMYSSGRSLSSLCPRNEVNLNVSLNLNGTNDKRCSFISKGEKSEY